MNDSENATDKFCVSCNRSGHTYQECDCIPFGGLLCGALGLPDILGDQKKAMEGLEKNTRRQRAGGNTNYPKER